MKRYWLGLLLATGCGLALANSAPPDLADLVKKDSQKAKRELDERGYELVSSKKDDGASNQFWWSRHRGSCAKVVINGGKVQKLLRADAKDCGESESMSGHHGGDHGDGWLRDLEGARASGLDPEMERRGFRNEDGHKEHGSSFTTWWNGKTRQCVEAEVRDGRIEDLGEVSEKNCR